VSWWYVHYIATVFTCIHFLAIGMTSTVMIKIDPMMTPTDDTNSGSDSELSNTTLPG